MRLIDINGCVFYTERDKEYFLKERSYRLDKKLYTGRFLTLIYTIKINISKDHQDKIVTKLKSKGFDDIEDAILSLSYNGYFESRNNDHYLGFMGSGYDKITGDAKITSFWEILSPTKELQESNLNKLLEKISDILEVNELVVLNSDEEGCYDDEYYSYLKQTKGDLIGYGFYPNFILD
jgi:uncharacterized protein YggL (DUF469 family)